jgi:molybdopterin/thiamine biosynthesis adenylyltransferase
LLVGAGGLGSTIALQLIQQGVGRLDIVDHDRVDTTNRARQFYTATDVGNYKAHALPKRLRPFATAPTTLRGYAATCQTAALDTDHNVIICGVDNDAANANIAARAHQHQTPAVFVNVSKDGEACRLFIQQPGGACFACYRPTALIPKPPQPCIPTPAIVDILHIAAGLAVRATTTLLHGDTIGPYNCRDLTMSGIDLTKTVSRSTTCPLCNQPTAHRQ